MQNIWVSLHSKRSRSTDFLASSSTNLGHCKLQLRHHQRLLHSTRFSRSCWVSSDTGHRWFEASLRSARLQGLPKVGPAKLLAAMFGDLGVSTLRSIKTLTRFFFSFEHQTSHAACFNARGLLYECVFDTLLFSSSYRPVGKPVFHHVVTRPTFFFSFFFGSLYRPSCPPRCSDTTLWVHPWCPLNFFIVVSIYWKSASYRSSLDLYSFGKTSNRSAAKSICSFLFWPTCILFDMSIALRLRHDLSKVTAPTPRSGACETWVPLVPHRPGSRPSPTSGSGLLEDPPTCQWAQPTWLAAHTTSWRPSRRFPRRPNPSRPQDLAYKIRSRWISTKADRRDMARCVT
jgi:hypothetical protein